VINHAKHIPALPLQRLDEWGATSGEIMFEVNELSRMAVAFLLHSCSRISCIPRWRETHEESALLGLTTSSFPSMVKGSDSVLRLSSTLCTFSSSKSKPPWRQTSTSPLLYFYLFHSVLVDGIDPAKYLNAFPLQCLHVWRTGQAAIHSPAVKSFLTPNVIFFPSNSYCCTAYLSMGPAM
jgi:hypothetical protein